MPQLSSGTPELTNSLVKEERSSKVPGRGSSVTKGVEKRNAMVSMGKQIASGIIRTLNLSYRKRLTAHCWQEQCLDLNKEHSLKLKKQSSNWRILGTS